MNENIYLRPRPSPKTMAAIAEAAMEMLEEMHRRGSTAVLFILSSTLGDIRDKIGEMPHFPCATGGSCVACYVQSCFFSLFSLYRSLRSCIPPPLRGEEKEQLR